MSLLVSEEPCGCWVEFVPNQAPESGGRYKSHACQEHKEKPVVTDARARVEALAEQLAHEWSGGDRHLLVLVADYLLAYGAERVREIESLLQQIADIPCGDKDCIAGQIANAYLRTRREGPG